MIQIYNPKHDLAGVDFLGSFIKLMCKKVGWVGPYLLVCWIRSVPIKCENRFSHSLHHKIVRAISKSEVIYYSMSGKT
jgi:hypothetical protein